MAELAYKSGSEWMQNLDLKIYVLLIIKIINVYYRKLKRFEKYKEKNEAALHTQERVPWSLQYTRPPPKIRTCCNAYNPVYSFKINSILIYLLSK